MGWTLLSSPQRYQLFQDGVNVGTRHEIYARCACGVEKIVRCRRDGEPYPRSCGCLQRAAQAQSFTTHGGSSTRLYKIYKGLFARCYNPNNTGYASYGGRGIRVVKAWQRFEPFRDWALANGYREDLQLDRINNDGPYSPNNCRWVTGKENCRNTSRTVWLEAFGERKSLQDWAEDPRCQVEARTLTTRIYLHKWDHETAISAPKGSRPYGRSAKGTYRVPGTENRVGLKVAHRI